MAEEHLDELADGGSDAANERIENLEKIVIPVFAPILADEARAIAERREAVNVAAQDGRLSLPDVSWQEDYKPSSTLVQAFHELEQTSAVWEAEESVSGAPSGLIGVALSGGGIRSSTFNLGVLQAIDRIGLFPYVDYLSTVSGGGYIGTYLTTSIKEQHEKEGPPQGPGESGDTESDQGGNGPINWFPFGHRVGEVETDRFRHLRNYSKFLAPEGRSELLSIPILLLRGFIINLLFLVPIFLFAGFALGGLMDVEQDYQYQTHRLLGQELQAWLGAPAGGFADALRHFPLTILLAGLLFLSFIGYPVAHRLRSGMALTENSKRRTRKKWLKRLRIALIVTWVLLFIELQPLVLANSQNIAQWLAGVMGGAAAAVPLADKIFSRLGALSTKIVSIAFGALGFALLWLLLLYFTKQVADGTWPLIPTMLTAIAALVFSLVLVDLNSTSIHSFYRDHLVKAFVAQAAADDRKELDVPADPVPRLSELDTTVAPYQLINTTVNTEQDDVKFRRGRHGSFFLFSPRYCGGTRTGYVPTRHYERIASTLDVGTAMAISGAAVAPNMGKFSNRFVSFMLALLNIRLNYWIQNPRRVRALAASANEGSQGPFVGMTDPDRALLQQEKLLKGWRVGPTYLLKEMFQQLTADSWLVNLSDGGHIENLGIYELMRRQCRLIIAGDGEADKELSFEGLTEAIRLARIDFGYRIEMDGLDEIRSGDQQFAVGTIYYTNDRIGKLIYIKSNLGGDYNLKSTLNDDFYRSSADRDDDFLYDENAYIAHYKDRNPDFPHESTADQFFDEAQFESYRALGYQVAASALIAPWVPDFETEVES